MLPSATPYSGSSPTLMMRNVSPPSSATQARRIARVDYPSPNTFRACSLSMYSFRSVIFQSRACITK